MIGAERGLALPMEGALPPDLQGTLLRAGPGTPGHAGDSGRTGTGTGTDGAAEATGPPLRGMLHAVELRDGQAVSYLRCASPADANVFWHARSVLALPERGIPTQYSRLLEPQEFAGALTVPIASHVRRDASDGSRVLFSVDDGSPVDGTTAGAAAVAVPRGEAQGVWLRLGEWDAAGALRGALAVELERATWQHDIGVTRRHTVSIESPTERLADPGGVAVPYGWAPGAEAWLVIVRRGADPADVRWVRLEPCLVTHVLGAYEDGDDIVLVVCAYTVPEQGQPVDRALSVVGPAGVGLTSIGGGLGRLERWRVRGDRVERTQLDDRAVEYPRLDAACEGASFRYGYCVESAWDGLAGGGPRAAGAVVDAGCHPVGLLKFDLVRDEVAAWRPEAGRTCSEALFVRAVDGHGDDEGWLLTVVQDPDRDGSDLYVLDASALGRRRPEAVIHLPERLPLRSHGEWVPADHYR